MHLEVNHNDNSLSLDEARKLLGDYAISDDDLLIIIEDLKILCSVAAHLYRNKISKKAA